MLSEVEDLEVLDENKLSFMEKFWGNSPEVRSTEENESKIFVKQSTEDVNESIEWYNKGLVLGTPFNVV